jgi:hypothetical protein
MTIDHESPCTNLAVLEERVEQLERRCDKKDLKIEVLQAFHNRAIGYSMASSAAVALIVQYFGGK